MLPDRVSNPGPLTYESGALPIVLRGPATNIYIYSDFKPVCAHPPPPPHPTPPRNLITKPSKWHVHLANTQIGLDIRPYLPFKRIAKTLIRLGECPG